MFFDPSRTYVHLGPDGSAVTMQGGEAFWARPETELDRFGRGWLVSEFDCASDWEQWEMHPLAEEFVYLLSGSARVVLDLAAGREEIPLDGRAAVVIPRGTWHTAKVFAPSRMLFVTMGHGTLHRPVEPGAARAAAPIGR